MVVSGLLLVWWVVGVLRRLVLAVCGWVVRERSPGSVGRDSATRSPEDPEPGVWVLHPVARGRGR